MLNCFYKRRPIQTSNNLLPYWNNLYLNPGAMLYWLPFTAVSVASKGFFFYVDCAVQRKQLHSKNKQHDITVRYWVILFAKKNLISLNMVNNIGTLIQYNTEIFPCHILMQFQGFPCSLKGFARNNKQVKVCWKDVQYEQIMKKCAGMRTRQILWLQQQFFEDTQVWTWHKQDVPLMDAVIHWLIKGLLKRPASQNHIRAKSL